MDRGHRWVMVHRVAESQTQLRDLEHTHTEWIFPSPALSWIPPELMQSHKSGQGSPLSRAPRVSLS